MAHRSNSEAAPAPWVGDRLWKFRDLEAPHSALVRDLAEGVQAKEGRGPESSLRPFEHPRHGLPILLLVAP